MKKIFTKKWWEAAGIRAIRTVAQTLAGSIPAGFVITPVMIQNANWTYLTVIEAWLATGIAAGIASLLTSLAGLPEVNDNEEA